MNDTQKNAVTRYEWIRIWGTICGSSQSYIDQMLIMAEKQNQPQNVVHLDMSSTPFNWSTTDDILDPSTRERMVRLAGKPLPITDWYFVNRVIYLKKQTKHCYEQWIKVKEQYEQAANELTEEQYEKAVKQGFSQID